jgi:hypothetical protein
MKMIYLRRLPRGGILINPTQIVTVNARQRKDGFLAVEIHTVNSEANGLMRVDEFQESFDLIAKELDILPAIE